VNDYCSYIDELKLSNCMSIFRTYQICSKTYSTLLTMEGIMRTIQQGLKTGSSEQGKASIDHCAGPNVSPDASDFIMAGLRLPPPGSKRWGSHSKAAVVAAGRGRILTLDEACEQYALSVEEYLTWQHGIDLSGLAGLRVNGPQ
jgi:hypothetical protein